MGEDIDNGVNHAAEDKGEPPMSVCVDFIHEAPEQDDVDQECSRRME